MTLLVLDVFPDVIKHPVKAAKDSLRRYRMRRLWGKVRVLREENDRLRSKVEAMDLYCKLLADAAENSRRYLEVHTGAAERAAQHLGLRDKR